MLTTGVCVFCHYNIFSWDSNGQLVTYREAVIRTIKIEESKKMEDYTESLVKVVNYYFKRPYACDLPVRRGTSIFSFYYGNIYREFDAKDYWKWLNGN